MESIAVTKSDMTVAGQGSLSPFGLLSQLFTEELVRRNGQAIGSYRPLRLAYLEEDEQDNALAAAPQINFDLDVNLLVNRLLREEKDKNGNKQEKEKKTPEQRILERVILREREIRMMAQDTRRVVIESGGRRVTASLPLTREIEKEPVQQRLATWQNGRKEQAEEDTSITRETRQETWQAGEGRSTEKNIVPRRSAGLARVAPVAIAAKGLTRQNEQTLTLASQAASVPAAGGWTPKQRETHPGYPMQAEQQEGMGTPAGSILLPDVMRRRREAALTRRETVPTEADSSEMSLEDALVWSMEGVEQTSETERVLRAVRRAVRETLRRNENRAASPREATASAKEIATHTADAAHSGSAPAETIHRENERTRETPAQNAAPTKDAIQPINAVTGIYREGERAPEALAQSAAHTVEASQPSTPEELIYREDAPEPETSAQTAVSTAKASQPNTPVELIYREDEHTPETLTQTAVPTVEASQPSTAAELTYREIGHTPETLTQTAVPTVEASQPSTAAELIYREGENIPETAAQTAVPTLESTAQPSVPAELIYREDESAPETAMQTAAPTAEASQPSAPAELTYREIGHTPEAPAQTAMPTAEPSTQPSASVELIYRESEPVSEAATQSAVPTAKSAAQPSVSAEPIYREDERRPEAATQTAAPTAEASQPSTAAELTYREIGHTPEAPAQTAMPTAEPSTQPSASVELIYRESEPVSEAATQSAVPTAKSAAQPSVSAEPIYRESEPVSEAATQSAVPTAKSAAQPSAPEELIYREDAPEPEAAAQTAMPTAEPSTQPSASVELIYREDERRPESATQNAAPTRENTAQPSVPAELIYREDESAPETAMQTAAPTAEASQPSAPAELIYRENEPAPETATQTAAEPKRVTAIPMRGETIAETIPRPVDLQFRKEQDTMQPAPAAGSAMRDMRVAAAQSARPKAHAPRPMTHIRQQLISHPEASAIPTSEENTPREPLELFFATSAAVAENTPPAARPTERAKQESEAERLPAWAKELMEQSGITDTAQQSAVFSGAASRQMNWTAAMPAQPQGKPITNPPELSFKEHMESEEPLYRRQISDAELRRTADKVYRMIEERLRRELRRSGR